MITPLVLAYYYSIEGSSTGQILRRFFPNLPQDRFSSFILSVKSKEDYNTNNCHIIGVQESRSAILAEKVLRNLGMNDLMMTPDYYRYSWGIKALEKSRKFLKERSFDYIHTISFPSSTHLLGYRLKTEFGIPWVAQFYDPWHNNPFRPIRCSCFQKLDARYESFVAKFADVIILPCDELVSDWLERYGSAIMNKVIQLPFIVDDSISIPYVRKDPNKLVISLIGSSNSRRTSISFYQALHQLLVKTPSIGEKLQVYQVGHIAKADNDMIEGLGLGNIIVRTGHLEEKACARYFEITDLFLAIDADIEKNYFFPSKLLQYYNYQKPILGLVTKNSVLSRELKQSGHTTIPVDDVEAIKQFLIRALDNYPSLCSFDVDYRKNFFPTVVLNKYIKCIEELLSKENV